MARTRIGWHASASAPGWLRWWDGTSWRDAYWPDARASPPPKARGLAAWMWVAGAAGALLAAATPLVGPPPLAAAEPLVGPAVGMLVLAFLAGAHALRRREPPRGSLRRPDIQGR